MGVIGYLGGLVGTGIVAASARLAVDELKDWTPTLTDRLIDRAVRRLPESRRERLAGEWRSVVAYTPGCLGKLRCAWGFGRAARHIERDSQQPGRTLLDQSLDAIAFVAAHTYRFQLMRRVRRQLRANCPYPDAQDEIVAILDMRLNYAFYQTVRVIVRRSGPARLKAHLLMETFATVAAGVFAEILVERASLTAVDEGEPEAGQMPESLKLALEKVRRRDCETDCRGFRPATPP